jgi:hypothetical protein
MIALLKIIYSLLFSLVTYSVHLTITSDTPTGWKVITTMLMAVASILLLSHYYHYPSLLPSKEIYILLILDAGLVIHYALNGFALRRVVNQLPEDNLKKPFFKTFINISELLRHNAVFFLIYLCQILTIWKPVQSYL